MSKKPCWTVLFTLHDFQKKKKKVTLRKRYDFDSKEERNRDKIDDKVSRKKEIFLTTLMIRHL